MFQDSFTYLSMDFMDYIDYDYISESSLDDFDLDPDYIPDPNDSSNESED